MTELLDAVDALTLPTYIRVIQPRYRTVMVDGRPKVDDAGNLVRALDPEKPTQSTRIRHDPLLTQLDDAIRGGMNTKAGSAESLKSMRGMIDSEALYHFTRITSMIRDWCRKLGVAPRDNPADELRAWYAAHIGHEHEPATERWLTRTMRAWAKLIEEKIDPHNERELPDPCPEPGCPQQFDWDLDHWTWWDPRTKEQYLHPLVVLYRPSDDALIVEKSHARCRACGTQWSGRALAWELEHAPTWRDDGVVCEIRHPRQYFEALSDTPIEVE